VHRELQRALGERESLQLKMQDYTQTLSHYEEAMSLKEQEKTQLIDSYNGLNLQSEKLNNTLKSACFI